MIKKYTLIALFLTLVTSCGPADTPATSGNTNDSFDRSTLLVNLADNIIIPAFTDLNVQLTTLKSKKDAFIATPNQTTLTEVRTAWLAAYKSWQHVEMFNIGEAEKTFYVFQMNVYPTNTTEIETNVTNGNADLTNPSNNDAVGFPALDYMLYGLADSEISILDKYTTSSNSDKYKSHLSDLVNQMQSITQNVLNDWKTNYRNTFVSSTANTATSALNKFVNDFVVYFEGELRKNKIGGPAGNFTGTKKPEEVEGFYSKLYSKMLAQESFNAVKNTYFGIHYTTNTNSIGLDDYLKTLNKEVLLNNIETQFNIIDNKLQVLNENFFEQINTDNTKMLETYDALQRAVVLFKTDMLQALGVRVDYADSDGD